jgi:hypothetical protein
MYVFACVCMLVCVGTFTSKDLDASWWFYSILNCQLTWVYGECFAPLFLIVLIVSRCANHYAEGGFSKRVRHRCANCFDCVECMFLQVFACFCVWTFTSKDLDASWWFYSILNIQLMWVYGECFASLFLIVLIVPKFNGYLMLGCGGLSRAKKNRKFNGYLDLWSRVVVAFE